MDEERKLKPLQTEPYCKIVSYVQLVTSVRTQKRTRIARKFL